jgi:hypothetical protein
MMRTAIVAATLLLLLSGCYGPGIMGWGSNGTTFEVAREDGFIEVTAVGRGPMKAVSEGASPEYVDQPSQWDEFALQFELSGMRAAFNAPANRSAQLIPAGRAWPLTNLANGTVRLHDQLYFCHMQADAPPYRFGVAIDSMGGGRVDYNLWFERLPRCS